MMDTINDRIKQLIEYQGFTAHGYEKKFGFKRGTLSNIIAGRRTKPGFDVLEKLITTNDAVNTDWLIKGVGPMLLTADYSTNDVVTSVNEPYNDAYQVVEEKLKSTAQNFLTTLVSEVEELKQRIANLENNPS